MKVLHLPTNIASQMSVTVRALRAEGIDARGLSGGSLVQDGSGIELLPLQGGPWPRRLWSALRRCGRISRAVAWADVVHWHYGPGLPGALDLKLARLLGRKRFVEFWGSDIRNPEIESAGNRWYAEAFADPNFECRAESAENSRRVQSTFARAGARALIPSPGMAEYLMGGCFAVHERTAQRVCLEDYPPVYPEARAARPLLVHAPTAPVTKGSRYILAAVEKLWERFDFDFKLITGMPHAVAREWISRCDVFIDQVVAGEYGLAAVEAMALGKPVVCFIKPSLTGAYAPGLPVVNAAPDTVEQVLEELLADGPRRRRTGELSRAWVEAHHDARKIARQLIGIYQAA